MVNGTPTRHPRPAQRTPGGPVRRGTVAQAQERTGTAERRASRCRLQHPSRPRAPLHLYSGPRRPGPGDVAESCARLGWACDDVDKRSATLRRPPCLFPISIYTYIQLRIAYMVDNRASAFSAIRHEELRCSILTRGGAAVESRVSSWVPISVVRVAHAALRAPSGGWIWTVASSRHAAGARRATLRCRAVGRVAGGAWRAA